MYLLRLFNYITPFNYVSLQWFVRRESLAKVLHGILAKSNSLCYINARGLTCVEFILISKLDNENQFYFVEGVL